MDMRLRDWILAKWVFRCKLLHSLAFFQWRYHHLDYYSDEVVVER